MKKILSLVIMFIVSVLTAGEIEVDVWPKEIVADCGNLQVRFESRSFWTLYRLYWKGLPLGTDVYGAHYGSVARFPGVGFIGSGHVENEKEQVRKLTLWVDGKPVEGIPSVTYHCREIRLVKDSAIRDLRLHTEILVCNDRVEEKVTMSAVKDTPLELIYHFMHPWSLEVKEYLALTTDGRRIGGVFSGDDKFHVNAPLQWSAVYAPSLNAGAVMVMREVPTGIRSFTKFWDVPTRYRKHYFQSFERATVKTGKEYRFSILVIPFGATPENWQAVAEKAAQM